MNMHENLPEAEYVPNALVELETSISVLAAHAHYEDALHVFRADVFTLMQKHAAIMGSGGWAVFEIPLEPEEGSVAVCPNKDMFILFESIRLRSSKRPKRVPNIRIIASERISVDDGEEYITTDVCVDSEDDSQYIVGSFPVRPSLEHSKSLVPILMRTPDGDLAGANFNAYPNMPCIEENGQKFFPFGHYNNLLDRVDALDVARSLLGEVMDITPRYVKSE